MRGNAALVALAVLCGCGDIIKKAPDGAPDDDAGTVEDGDIADVLPVDAPPIDVPPGAPNIVTMTPDWGSTAGGTNVKITGVGFSEPNLVVRFGTVAVQTAVVVSDTELRVVTAAGPHQAVDLSVTTAGGVSTFPVKFRNLAPLYASDARKATTPKFYSINPATGAATLIGNTGANVTALALSPAGIMFALAGPVAAGQPNRLVTVNPYTGALTLVANITGGISPDIAFVGNTLVGWRGNQMAVINTSTGVFTLSTASMNCSGCGMAANGATSMLFAPLKANQALYTVNIANGVPSAGPAMNSTITTEGVLGMTFVGSQAYASLGHRPTTSTTSARLARLNPVNGVLTIVGALPNDIDAIEGIPAQPVIPKTAGNPEAELADELATTAVRFDNTLQYVAPTTTPPSIDVEPATVVWHGASVATNDLMALHGTDRELAGTSRRVVPLAALADGARTAVLVSGTETKRFPVTEHLAIVQNKRGELKLVDTSVGSRRLFGPITELRFAR